MKKTTYSKLAILTGIALLQSQQIMAQAPSETGDLSGVYNTISKYLGWGLAVAILICIGMAGFHLLLSENGAAGARKYILGIIGCAVIWALKDSLISAFI